MPITPLVLDETGKEILQARWPRSLCRPLAGEAGRDAGRHSGAHWALGFRLCYEVWPCLLHLTDFFATIAVRKGRRSLPVLHRQASVRRGGGDPAPRNSARKPPKRLIAAIQKDKGRNWQRNPPTSCYHLLVLWAASGHHAGRCLCGSEGPRGKRPDWKKSFPQRLSATGGWREEFCAVSRVWLAGSVATSDGGANSP